MLCRHRCWFTTSAFVLINNNAAATRRTWVIGQRFTNHAAAAAVASELCRLGRPAKALEVYENAIQALPHDVALRNAGISAYIKDGKVEVAAQLFEWMKNADNKCLPDQATYALLIDAYSQQGRVEAAEQLLEEMLDGGLNLSVEVCNAVVRGYLLQKGTPQAGLKSLALWNAVKEINPNMQNDSLRQFLYSVLTVLCKDGDLELAQNFFHENLKEENTFRGHSVMITAFLDKGMIDEAELWLKNFVQLKPFQLVPPFIFASFAKACMKHNDLQKLEIYCERLREVISKNSSKATAQDYAILITSYFRAGKTKEGLSAFKEAPLQVTIGRRVLKSFFQRNEVQEANIFLKALVSTLTDEESCSLVKHFVDSHQDNLELLFSAFKSQRIRLNREILHKIFTDRPEVLSNLIEVENAFWN